MSKLLLSTVCRPLGIEYGDSLSVGYELLHEQVTRAQGIFSPRSLIHHFSLEYIAHNLDTPTVVLQYPSEKEFIRELKQEYDYVGLSFVLATFDKMVRQVALIRKYAPHSKIVLGGYGTTLPDEDVAPYGDYICREEGIGFLRKLLGEEPKPMPYDHPLIVNGLKVFSVPLGNNGMIFAGLGCPNGCDFCVTSHFFRRKHVRLLPEGDHIFEVIQRYREMDSNIKFTVLDEDFLLNQKRARRFLELVRQSGQEPPMMFVFSSIKALSQYDVKELLEMGVCGVWIGYEGKRSGYSKQQGRSPEELFREFRENGIMILASMIIGFDYQSPEIIRSELDELLSHKPTFSQILIYGPVPGTPFYDRISKENRLHPIFQSDRRSFLKHSTGFYNTVRHVNMSMEQIEALQKECFERDFKILGPSTIRAVESWFLGYKKLVAEKSDLLRKRAERYRKDICDALPVFYVTSLLGPSKSVKEHARKMYVQIATEFRMNSFMMQLKLKAAFLMACWTAICLKFRWFQHPKLIRLAYRMSN